MANNFPASRKSSLTPFSFCFVPLLEDARVANGQILAVDENHRPSKVTRVGEELSHCAFLARISQANAGAHPRASARRGEAAG